MIPTPHTVSIYRPTFTLDLSGGQDAGTFPDDYTVVQTNYPAFVQNASPDMVEDFGRREIKISHSVYFDDDPTTKVNDVILWGAKQLFVRVSHDLCNLDSVYVAYAEQREAQ